MKKKLSILLQICFVFVLLIGVGILFLLGKDTDSTTDNFIIYITDATFEGPYPYRYTDNQWADILANSKLVRPFITDKDIQTFDWDKQEILLTKKASAEIIATQNRVDVRSYPMGVFIVVLNGERLYAGSFIEAGSAMAIMHPVIHLENNPDGTIKLIIRPIHFLPHNYDQKYDAFRKYIEIPKLREYVQ